MDSGQLMEIADPGEAEAREPFALSLSSPPPLHLPSVYTLALTLRFCYALWLMTSISVLTVKCFCLGGIFYLENAFHKS